MHHLSISLFSEPRDAVRRHFGEQPVFAIDALSRRHPCSIRQTKLAPKSTCYTRGKALLRRLGTLAKTKHRRSRETQRREPPPRRSGLMARGRAGAATIDGCTDAPPSDPLPPLYPLSLEGACCSVPFRGGASMRSSRERAGVFSLCLSFSIFFAQLRDRDYAGTKTEAATTTRQWRQSFSVSAADSTSGLESHVVTPLSAVVPLPRSP